MNVGCAPSAAADFQMLMLRKALELARPEAGATGPEAVMEGAAANETPQVAANAVDLCV